MFINRFVGWYWLGWQTYSSKSKQLSLYVCELSADTWLSILRNVPIDDTLNVFLVSYRYSIQKPTCRCTLKFTCVKPNHTSVHSVRNHLPTLHIFRSTVEFIWASNPTDARFVNANSLNFPTYSSISVRIPATSHTSVAIPIVRKHSRSSRIYSHIRGHIKPISHSNVTAATSVSPMRPVFLTTFRSIKNRNIWKLTFANSVANPILKKRISRNICRNIRIEWRRGHKELHFRSTQHFQHLTTGNRQTLLLAIGLRTLVNNRRLIATWWATTNINNSHNYSSSSS